MPGYLARVAQAARVALPELRRPAGFGEHRATVWRSFNVAPARAWSVLSDWRAPYISASGTGFVVSGLPGYASQKCTGVQYYDAKGETDGQHSTPDVGSTRDMECKGHPRVSTSHAFRQELVEFDANGMTFAYRNVTPMFLYPVGFPVQNYGCRVAVAHTLPGAVFGAQPTKCRVRWSGYFNTYNSSAEEVRAGLRVLYASYLEAAGELMLLEPEERNKAVAELVLRIRKADAEARAEASEAPASAVKPT